MKNTQINKCTSHDTAKSTQDEKLRAYALLDMINELCFALDHDFRMTYVNRYTLEVFDKTANELIGQSLHEIFPYTKTMFDIDALTKSLDTGRTLVTETQSPLSGAWFQTTAVAFQDEYLIYMLETSTTKRYEKLLYEKDSLYLAVTAAMSDFIIIVDSAGRVSHATPTAENFTGFARDELEGRKFLKFIAAENHEAVQGELQKTSQAPTEPVQFMITMNHKDGSTVAFHATAQNLLEQPGVDGILLKLTP